MTGLFQTLRHVALVALLLRAMLPAGWMPDAHGLTICSATLGAVHHDTVPGQADGKTAHEECPFAASAHMAAAPDAPSLALPSVHAFAATIDRAHAAVIAAHFSPGAPRAPPLNA